MHLGDCGHGAFGGTVAAPAYFATMTALLGDTPASPVPAPDPAYLQPGPRPVVPYTAGTPATSATAALQRAGYPAAAHPVASARPAREVVGQTPQGNARAGTPVTLLVSTGAPG